MTKVKNIFKAVCLRKRNWSEADANNFIDWALKEKNQLLYYYKCPLCNSIHLTKKVPTNRSDVQYI